MPPVPDDVENARYRFHVFVRPGRPATNLARDRIIEELAGLGIPCYQGGCLEGYREKAIHATGLGLHEPLPTARELGETGLMYLFHPTPTEKEIGSTRRGLGAVLSKATA